jgi:mannose-6-phosphate isomerase-like protein (cupin superfamily)
MMKPEKCRIVEKVWGEEVHICNILDLGFGYCGKVLRLKKDHQCSIHFHKTKHETFFIKNGRCLMEWGDTHDTMSMFVFTPGMVLTLEQKTFHRFSGIDPMTEIFEISTTDFPEDSYRLTESRYVENGSKEWNKYAVYPLY